MSVQDFVNRLRGTSQAELDAMQQALDSVRERLAARNAERDELLATFRATFGRHRLKDENLWKTFAFTHELLLSDKGVTVNLRHKDFKGILASAGPIALHGHESPAVEIDAAWDACMCVILGAFPL